MRLKSATVTNHKSFDTPAVLNFFPGFNIIIGKNNSGKTALLDQLSTPLSLGAHPHLSPDADIYKPRDPKDRVYLFLVSPDELRSIIDAKGYIDVPIPHGGDPNAALENGALLPVIATRTRWSIAPGYLKNYQICRVKRINNQLRFASKGEAIWNNIPYQELGQLVKIHKFSSLRRISDSSIYKDKPALEPGCENLVLILSRLRSENRPAFDFFLESVKYVLPEIEDIAFNLGAGQVTAALWSHEFLPQSPNFSRMLSESGTGVGQVLALLYVATVIKEPQIVLIDELQSFLHPGAIRRLIDILRRNLHHQYIITTHSALVVSACKPSVIHVLKKERFQTTVESFSEPKIREFNAALEEVGASVDDIFGVDKLVWVEGKTEEKAFPILVDSLIGGLTGIRFLEVRTTGAFDKKRRKMTLDTYKTLSSSGSLMPRGVRFVFDRESLSDTEIEDFEREGKGDVLFAPRRLFENHLLHPAAIAKYFSSLISGRDFDGEYIQGWIEEYITALSGGDTDAKKRLRKLFPKGKVHRFDSDEFRNEVHGAVLLEEMLRDLSGEAPVEYRKATHSVELASLIAEEHPEHLEELKQFLNELIASFEGPSANPDSPSPS